MRRVRLNGPRYATRVSWLSNRLSRLPLMSPIGAQRAAPKGKRRFLTSAQFAEMRRKLADVDAKLRQLSAAERGRRR